MSPTLLAAGLTLALPATAALVLAAVPALRRLGSLAAALCIASSTASLASAALVLASRSPGAPAESVAVPWLRAGSRVVAEIGLHVDAVSASMLAVVGVVALCVQVFSLEYLHDEPSASRGRYFAYHALFLLSMNVLVLAPNLLQLFAGWELVGVTSYLLIGYWFRKPSAGRAAVKAFWVTKLADMGFLVGLLALYVASGSFGWEAHLSTPTATFVTALLFVAVVGKSAQFPLHVWLPDAMEGPTPVSALLHAATMVAAGVFLVVRADPLFAQAPATRSVMLALGAGTALFGACLALVQADIKKVLAYSTCSQLGYMLAALGAGGTFAAFFHLTTHAFFKALLFLGAGSVIHAVHGNELARMGGLAKRMPLTAATFVIGAVALAGIPGTAGFFSKDLVLEAVEGRLGGVPWAALLLTAGMTAFYMGRVVIVAFFGVPRTREASHAHEPGWSMKGPLVVLAVPSLAFGAVAGRFARLHGEAFAVHATMGALAASALALAGVALAVWTYGLPRAHPTPAPLAWIERVADAGAVDCLYLVLYRRGALRLASATAWVDRYVVDGAVNIVGWASLRAGDGMRAMQTGYAPDYVLAVVLGALAMAVWGVVQ